MVLFENAPVAFAMSLVTLLVTAFGPSRNSMDVNAINKTGDYGRILSSQFGFESTSELIVALVLIYSYRLFESQMGSRKYGAFVLITLMLASLLQFFLLLFFASADMNIVPSSGLYFFVFAQLAFFYRYIPKLYMTQYVFMGLEFSEKSGIYLLALQLFFSGGIRSIFPSLIGLFVGFLYARNTLNVQKVRLPAIFDKFFKLLNVVVSTLFPFTNQPQPRPRGNNNGNAANNFMAQQFQPRPAREPAFELPPPDEESIQTLMNLGFDREAVVQALRQSGNNVDAAANRLLR